MNKILSDYYYNSSNAEFCFFTAVLPTTYQNNERRAKAILKRILKQSIDMHTHAGSDLDLWPFDLRVDACQATAMHYISTKFDVDSSSRFPFTVWTHRHRQSQIQLFTLPTAWLMPVCVITTKMTTCLCSVSEVTASTAEQCCWLSHTADTGTHSYWCQNLTSAFGNVDYDVFPSPAAHQRIYHKQLVVTSPQNLWEMQGHELHYHAQVLQQKKKLFT